MVIQLLRPCGSCSSLFPSLLNALLLQLHSGTKLLPCEVCVQAFSVSHMEVKSHERQIIIVQQKHHISIAQT